MTTPEQIQDLTKLLPEELDEVRDLFFAWKEARERKEWELADKLRVRFWWWDELLGNDGLWHPIFEYNLNRQRRAFKRMQRYKVDVYPWDLDMVA